MFGLFTAMMFFGCNVLNLNALNAILLKCVSMNNEKCKIRPEYININSYEPLFYPYSIEINKCMHMQNYVFLMLLKNQISKYLIRC